MNGGSLPNLFQPADPIAPSYQNAPQKYWTLCSPEPSLEHEREANLLRSEKAQRESGGENRESPPKAIYRDWKEIKPSKNKRDVP